jgi:receptor protein-tyrosine kinase
MSIVEKALRKAQTPPQADAPLTTSAERHEERRAEPVSKRSTAVVPEAPPFRVGVDLEKLRGERLLAPASEQARVRDEYRRIKWPLLETAKGLNAATLQRANFIMVTSSVANEGKTFTAINLALSIATERDSSVLLVDTDISKPNITRVLGLEGRKGLVDVLLDEQLDLKDVIVGTDIEGLTVLPAGRSHILGPELLASQRMAAIVEELSELRLGRIVLFDSSPLLATNEAQVLSRLVGQVIMVVKADSTPQAAVKEALALVSNAANVVGLLNQTHTGAFSKYHEGYYGYPKE